MKKGKLELKSDEYRSARGGYSRVLSISCRACERVVLKYQKDGPGNLRRLYLDRIISPDNLAALQYRELKDTPPLKCSKCGELLGTPYIYIKEKRKAFRLYQDSVIKRVTKM